MEKDRRNRAPSLVYQAEAQPAVSRKESTQELGLPRALVYSACYFGLLLPSLTFALNTYVDLADPPVFNPNVYHGFLLSPIGGWLWFGAAIAAPAMILFALSYLFGLLRRCRKCGHALT